MKKIFALLIVLAMSVSVLASCNNGGGTDTGNNDNTNTDTNTDNGNDNNPLVTHEITEAQFDALFSAKPTGAAVLLFGDDAPDWKATATSGSYTKDEETGEEKERSVDYYAYTKDGNTYKKEYGSKVKGEEGEEAEINYSVNSYVVVSKNEGNAFYTVTNYYKYYDYSNGEFDDSKIQEQYSYGDNNIYGVMGTVIDFYFIDDAVSGIFRDVAMFGLQFSDVKYDAAKGEYSLKEAKTATIENGEYTIEKAELKLTNLKPDHAYIFVTGNDGDKSVEMELSADLVYEGNTVTCTVVSSDAASKDGEVLYEYKDKSVATFTYDNSGRVVKIVETSYEWKEKEVKVADSAEQDGTGTEVNVGENSEETENAEEEKEYEFVENGTATTEIVYGADGKISKITRSRKYGDTIRKNEINFTYGEQTIVLPEIVTETEESDK